MTNIAAVSSARKFELTPNSSGTAADGGWRRWWAIEARRCGSDWRTLIDCAEAALFRLRTAHVSSS
jgi:hypothetical protein